VWIKGADSQDHCFKEIVDFRIDDHEERMSNPIMVSIEAIRSPYRQTQPQSNTATTTSTTRGDAMEISLTESEQQKIQIKNLEREIERIKSDLIIMKETLERVVPTTINHHTSSDS
jgi:hypothetical protein